MTGARRVTGQEGELVLTAPLPSMPVGFWGDKDGTRYREAYFSRFPGVWAHGDRATLTDRGTVIITGRSDGTLNRGGVRMGTAEFYAVVERFDEVTDSLVVHVEDPGGGPGELWLFVVAEADDGLPARIRGRPAARSVAPARPRSHRQRPGRPANPLGEEAGGAGEAHPERRPRHPGSHAGFVGQPREPGSLHHAGAGVGAADCRILGIRQRGASR